ncbi:MAG TPA: hypothetical protein VJJ23_05795 [Candidatus Nanoarchaeia archaeon]|nr:hypothetical protein [Candidatus Nanoarchaeia archaeon]
MSGYKTEHVTKNEIPILYDIARVGFISQVDKEVFSIIFNEDPENKKMVYGYVDPRMRLVVLFGMKTIEERVSEIGEDIKKVRQNYRILEECLEEHSIEHNYHIDFTTRHK